MGSEMVLLATIVAVLLAYLAGSIPFAYVVAKLAAGVDVRTVGSGNVGATNVGRVLGLRYFLLVFALDLAKGLLPTWGFPIAVERLAGPGLPPGLAVFVAMATIVGHNYPVFLKFQGGKGVATSLGAFAALDPAAALGAGMGFLTFLTITRYVSLSSILGALVFVVVHFTRVDAPWGREQLAMTVVTLGLFGLMIVRHRGNLGRIAAGTEPKVPFSRRRKQPPAGKSRGLLVAGLAALGLGVATGGWVAINARRAVEAQCGPLKLVEVARASTGHQRAGRLAFADGGSTLAVACTRYNRVVIYRVGPGDTLTLAADVEVDGRPVAMAEGCGGLVVLQRPTGDDRHLEEGYFEVLGLDGKSRGPKVRVGWDPDDLAITPDGRRAIVVTSGHAEGETGRPDPALVVVSLAADPAQGGEIVARLPMIGEGVDPDRLALSDSGTLAAVALLGTNEVAAIDLADPSRPALIGRELLAVRDVPHLSRGEGDAILMPADTEREAVVVGAGGAGRFVVTTMPNSSGIEVVDAGDRRALGRLTLRGPANLGTIRPTGLAHAPGRSLLAVANRSGGIHLIRVEGRAIAAAEGPARR